MSIGRTAFVSLKTSVILITVLLATCDTFLSSPNSANCCRTSTSPSPRHCWTFIVAGDDACSLYISVQHAAGSKRKFVGDKSCNVNTMRIALESVSGFCMSILGVIKEEDMKTNILFAGLARSSSTLTGCRFASMLYFLHKLTRASFAFNRVCSSKVPNASMIC